MRIVFQITYSLLFDCYEVTSILISCFYVFILLKIIKKKYFYTMIVLVTQIIVFFLCYVYLVIIA
jgi:hypothetical protein